jgi:hypothetical protein
LLVSTRESRARGKEKEPSHLVTTWAAFSRDVNLQDGALEFSLLYTTFLMALWLSPLATDPISKLAKPLLPLQLSLVPSEGPLINQRLTPKRVPPFFALLFYLLIPPPCSPAPLPPPCHCLTTSRCLRRQLFPTFAENKSFSHTA